MRQQASTAARRGFARCTNVHLPNTDTRVTVESTSSNTRLNDATYARPGR
jgi:hypothetical protein